MNETSKSGDVVIYRQNIQRTPKHNNSFPVFMLNKYIRPNNRENLNENKINNVWCIKVNDTL